MKLTIVFPDYRIQAQYANGENQSIDMYTDYGDSGFSGSDASKLAFETVVSDVGHNMDDYWAIQYSGGQQIIEFANGSGNQIISSNTGLSEYLSLINTWQPIFDEEQRIANLPTWDDIRQTRDTKLTESDKIVAWSVETGNAIPQDWTDYRQDLRDITDTYGAPTGNTELVVYPDEPSWPTS